jgi:hypothetical protein
MTQPLHERMRAAADTIEEVSAQFGYPNAEYAPWFAAELRSEADVLEAP